MQKMDVKMYVLMVFMQFTDAESCREEAEKVYPGENVQCTMFIRQLPTYMPPPLDRPEMWSCEKRPTLCLMK